MNKHIIDEGNLRFDFTHCGTPIKFDIPGNSGLYAVDFVVEEVVFAKNEQKYSIFLEVKDYHNPNTPCEQRRKDRSMLISAGKTDESAFAIKMGAKIKDSLLCMYARGDSFTNNVLFLLFINSDGLKSSERLNLFGKIYGQIPTGLNNDERFPAFTKINFKIVDSDDLRKYGIVSVSKQLMEGVGSDE